MVYPIIILDMELRNSEMYFLVLFNDNSVDYIILFVLQRTPSPKPHTVLQLFSITHDSYIRIIVFITHITLISHSPHSSIKQRDGLRRPNTILNITNKVIL